MCRTMFAAVGISVLGIALASTAGAATYVVEVRGTVTTAFAAPYASELNAAKTGEAVRLTYAFNTNTFPFSASDGSTYLTYGQTAGRSIRALRSRVTIGGRPFNVENSVFPRDGVAEADGNAEAALPGLGFPADNDIFFVSQSSTDADIFNDPGVTAARQRIAFVIGLAPGSSSFITGPLASLDRQVSFAGGPQWTAMIQDDRLARDAATGQPVYVEVGLVFFSVDRISIRRCRNSFRWLTAGGPWPKELECEK
jgi:hypothetical protein